MVVFSETGSFGAAPSSVSVSTGELPSWRPDVWFTGSDVVLVSEVSVAMAVKSNVRLMERD